MSFILHKKAAVETYLTISTAAFLYDFSGDEDEIMP